MTKKIILLFCIFFSCVTTGKPIDPGPSPVPAEPEPSSIPAEPKTQAEPDRQMTQAEIYHSQGVVLYNNQQFPEALDLFLQAEQSAFKQGDESFLFYNYSWLGAAYGTLGDVENALISYRNSINLGEKLEQYEDLLGVIGAKAGIHRQMSQYDQEIACYRQALVISEKLEQWDYVAWYWNNIGLASFYLQDYSQAIAAYQESHRIYKELDQVEYAVQQLTSIANLYYYAGDRQQALEYYQQALESGYLAAEDHFTVLNTCAGIRQEQEQSLEALEYYQQSLDLAGQTGNTEGIMQVARTMAEIYSSLEQYNRGIEYYQQAAAACEQLQDEQTGALIRNDLGVAWYSLREYTRALEQYQKALQLNLSLDQTEDAAVVYNNMGVVQKDRGYYQLAVDHFLAALEIYREIKLDADIAWQLTNIGLTWDAAGEFHKAIDYYRQSNAVYRDPALPDFQENLNNIGSAYLSLQDYQQAVDFFQQSLQYLVKEGDEERSAVRLSNLGLAYHYLEEYDKAEQYYLESLDLAGGLDNRELLATVYAHLGALHSDRTDYPRALEYCNRGLAITRAEGRDSQTAVLLNNIAFIYAEYGEYSQAFDFYEQALAINRQLQDRAEIASQLGSIGHVHSLIGHFDQAIDYYQQALDLALELGNEEKIAVSYNNIGEVYRAWGKYDITLQYFDKALAIDKKTGQRSALAVLYNNYGQVYRAREELRTAMEYYRQALDLNLSLGRLADVALVTSNIGETYRLQGEYEKAIAAYEEAFAIEKELGLQTKMAIRLNNIGLVLLENSQAEEALEYFFVCLEINEQYGQPVNLASNYNNIGAGYYHLKDYTQAAAYFKKAVEIKEQLRLTSKGSIRMDYLASQLYTYKYLWSAYIQKGDNKRAFDFMELSVAKYLAEQMKARLGGKDLVFSGLDTFQKQLDRETAVICYADTIENDLARFIITGDSIIVTRCSSSNFTGKVRGRLDRQIDSTYDNLRGIKIIKKTAQEIAPDTEESEGEFDKIIAYYRHLLARGKADNRSSGDFAFLSRELFDLLLKDTAPYLEDKKNIIILPRGILAFLPFETLLMDNGNYLIEKYDIRYVQSLSVSGIINQRQYKHDRQPLLAFGGAVYEQEDITGTAIASADELAALKAGVQFALAEGSSTGRVYAALGITEWGNLPGTLDEVLGIRGINPAAEIITGSAVNESAIKKMSQTGELKNYRVIHFATHGLVVPEIPELSALVLSLDESDPEDGYLQMREIAGFELNADFVNLSACETGLGKIYGGEGVVGLTQSFLIAGANGLSVSLWQVADESTMRFMLEFYKLVENSGLSYNRAINAVKRMFISGEIEEGRYANPFFWAPFVYYGK